MGLQTTERFHALRLSTVVAVLLSVAPYAYTQESHADTSLDSHRQPPTSVQETNVPVTLRVTTREVLIDMIAIDNQGQTVANLRPGDLEVSVTSDGLDLGSTGKHRRPKAKNSAERESITSLRLNDPNAPQSSEDNARGGFQIGAGCLVRATQHYQLAFRPGPEGWHGGNHKVAITTTRHGVKLIYLRQYYVGLSTPKPDANRSEAVEKSLRRAACDRSETPPSMSLRVKWMDTGRVDVLRYSVSIDADSLSFVTLESSAPGSRVGIDRSVKLDYAACTFDSRGVPIHFYHSPLDATLTSADYARVLDRGLPHILEFPAPEKTAMARLVVRDRPTGNIGTIDLPYPRLEKDLSNSQRDEEIRGQDSPQVRSFNLPALQVLIGSFGSVVPDRRSFCGDVYELPQGLQKLPDFRLLASIGSVYTPVLDITNQSLSNNSQTPGIMPTSDGFGLDYHGVLWITQAGNYGFQILSDDGAMLRVDDKNLIDVDGTHPAQLGSNSMYLDAGRHSIEVRYYEDGLGAIALKLMVKQPGAGSWTILDLRDYALPSKK